MSVLAFLHPCVDRERVVPLIAPRDPYDLRLLAEADCTQARRADVEVVSWVATCADGGLLGGRWVVGLLVVALLVLWLY